MTREAFLAAVDVAFNDNVTKVLKKSYDKAIDVQYGIYKKNPFAGCLTVNLKPTSGLLDWWYNILAFPKKTDHGRVMAGYQKEIEKYRNQIITDIITVSKQYPKCLAEGIIVSGRSKGAGEAILLVPTLSDFGTVYVCGAIEPPKVCDHSYSEYLNSLGTDILITSYRNDILTALPPWFEHPAQVVQLGKRTHGLSIKDHRRATESREVFEKEFDRERISAFFDK